MIPRPYLDKVMAVLLAGFLWLVMAPAVLPWHQGSTGALSSILAHPALAAEPGQPHKAAVKPPAPTPGSPQAATTPIRWNNLIRVLAGGLLAGVLWSVLFGYPFYTYWPDRPLPLGLLDVSVLAVFFYLAYLAIASAIRGRRKPPELPCPAFLKFLNQALPTLTVNQEAEAGIQAILESDSDLDLAAFGEFACRVMEDLHAAWNRQDLEPLTGLVSEDILEYLGMGLKIMHLREEISCLEDVCINRLVVTTAGREGSRDFIALQVEGRVMDYILQKNSYKLVSGSLTYPSTLKEFWRFERSDGQPWKLVDIQGH